MNLKTNAITAAVVLGLSGGAHATTIDDASANGSSSDLIVMVKKAGDESLLVNTNLSTLDVFNGTANWVSDAGLTAAISDFLGGSTDATAWAFGAFKNSNFDFGTVTSKQVQFSQTENQSALGALNGYASLANNGAFGADAAADGDNVENVTGIPELDWINPTLNDFVNPGFGLDQWVALSNTRTDFFGGGTTHGAESLVRLASDGSLSVAPVPVPAAVWLLGSALLGLVGAARRRGARV